MIVYRNFRRPVRLKVCLGRIYALIDRLKAAPRYDQAVSLLIETGELETGITDAAFDGKDKRSAQTALCRNITLQAGRIVCQFWDQEQFDRQMLSSMENLISRLISGPVPERITSSVPEGFAYYGLYPETYMEAADKFASETGPDSVLVIGLRSIGTSLSALVAARLEVPGRRVESFTVRPKGHPFDKQVKLSDVLKEKIAACSDGWVVIVDEGPGLSGSSIAGTILKCRECGAAQCRTVVFPSWLPDGGTFISPSAREVWGSHRKYLGDFNRLWIDSGRLERTFGRNIVSEISAGMWRRLFYSKESDYPGIHLQHERKKFLLGGDGKIESIAKFIGLGRYGKSFESRAESLCDAGFCPALEKITSGFAILDYVDGQPVRPAEIDSEMMKAAAHYCAFIKQNLPGEPTTTYDSMVQMMRENITEGLGEEWAGNFQILLREFSPSVYETGIVDVDGRMVAHEWIRTSGGFKKVDHLEHHADEFFHGPQNIAWDIAGFCVENYLGGDRRERFIRYYAELTRDHDVYRRMRFFTVAYLAFRLGYAVLARDTLKGDPDGGRFAELEQKYRSALKRELQL